MTSARRPVSPGGASPFMLTPKHDTTAAKIETALRRHLEYIDKTLQDIEDDQRAIQTAYRTGVAASLHLVQSFRRRP